MYGCMYGRMEGWTDVWTYGRMDGWMDVWMDGWMDVWMDGWLPPRFSASKTAMSALSFTLISHNSNSTTTVPRSFSLWAFFVIR